MTLNGIFFNAWSDRFWPRLASWIRSSDRRGRCLTHDAIRLLFVFVPTVSCCGMGQIIVTKEEDFRTITADQIYEWWRDRIGVDAQHFDRIVNGCLKQE